jgi:cell division protein ZapA (FtsZ GTPase activity inhibitor)
MMNSDRLARRIDQALKAIEQQRQQLAAQRLALPLHLLTTGEQEQLVAFLDQLRKKYACEHISKDTLRLVTDEELDRLGNWIDLLDALEQEDLDAASRYRRALAAQVA